MTDWRYEYPKASVIYTLLIAHLNSACNPILYATFNPSFKRGYGNIFKFFSSKLLDKSSEKCKIKTLTHKEADPTVIL
jgi:hypothetical protein